jgi:hypothetical protein
VLQAETKALQLHLPLDKAARGSRWLSAKSGSGTAYGKSRLPLLIERLNGSSIFRLTRVTRIFQKKILTGTTPAPGRFTAPGFLLREAACAAARGGSSWLQKKQENTGKYRGSRN